MAQGQQPQGPPAEHPARGADGFEASYVAGEAPWDIGRPQAVFQALADEGRLAGSVLDVGCGTGEHALLAAAAGRPATGIDGAPTAIAIARGKADQRGLVARFLVWDALELARLAESFDTVLDCGLFHVFEDRDRPAFEAGLRAVTAIGGRYHLLCFSDQEPGEWGPRRIGQEEIRATFHRGWRVEEIASVRIETTFDSEGARAWHATLLRV